MDSHDMPVGEDELAPADADVSTDAEPDSLEEAPTDPMAEQEASETHVTDLAELTASVEASAEASPEQESEPSQMTIAAQEEQPGEEIQVADDAESTDVQPPAMQTGLRRGDLLEGVIVRTSPTEIQVSLGEHGEGVVNSRELERLTSSTLHTLEEGTAVLVYVLSATQNGRTVLSISRALEESDWRTAEEYLENKTIYQGKIAGYNRGGLIVRFGRLRGFIPASQISPERRERAGGSSPEERWGEMLGESIEVKVVELKRSRNRLILSEQAAVRDIREREKSRLLEELQVGDRRKGHVTSLTDFGVFVDLGGADGLVHLTELSWKHITHPGEVVEVGQEVDVEVISIDRRDRRIGLSIRRLANDPWADVENEYIKGQLIQASITKLTKFGAFARLVDQPEIEGLIHVSELSEHRVRHPREVVSKGDVLTLRIIKIDREQRRLGLSLKQVDSPEYMDIDWKLSDSDDETG